MTKIDIENKNKRVLRCPLFILLGFSIVGMLLFGIIVRLLGIYDVNMSWETPAFVNLMQKKDVFTLLKQGTFASMQSDDELGEMAELEATKSLEAESKTQEALDLMAEAEKEGITSDTAEKESTTEDMAEKQAKEEQRLKEESLQRIEARYVEEYGEVPFSIDDGTITRYVKWNDNAARSRYYTNIGIRPVSTAYDYKTVDNEYYKNSIFIGDSRMQGLHDYSGWENVTFCYKVGLNVYTMMTAQIRTNEGKSTVPEMLSARQYENVYIMLGINELGIGVPSNFAEEYQKNIDEVRKLQPNARIIIMGIMFEAAEYSDKEAVYNNDNINARNAAIAKLANGEDIFYLDMNPAVSEGGALIPDITFDGVHLLAKHYHLLTEFMYGHGY